MKIDFLHEPELEFGGGGQHIDIRFGLMLHGPLDQGSGRAPVDIKLAIVGITETVEGVARWLERCRSVIPAKRSKQPNLFPRFPGFARETLGSELIIDRQLQATIMQRAITSAVTLGRTAAGVDQAVDVFLEQCQHLAEKARPDVLICAPPADLLEMLDPDEDKEETEEPASQAGLQSQANGAEPHNGVGQAHQDKAPDDVGREDVESDEDAATAGEEDVERKPPTVPSFHDVLKARGMGIGIPIQMVRPETYDAERRRRQKARPDRIRQLQDEATRAWNFHMALYYKAGGTPWRLVREAADYSTCYVGVSFYKSSDDDALLMTSMAQVFNERGDGVIVRGGQARLSKLDRRPHLDLDGARTLLQTALASYRREHKTSPARVVVHKTSGYNDDELAGFRKAAEAERIEGLDLISLRHSSTRLFRVGDYPPLRGTLVEMDERTHLLYTRGSVDFFAAYAGMYVPRPLEFLCQDTEQTPRFLASEMLGLSKMNWNNTQFDGADPITTRAADQVGSILRHVPDHVVPQARYAYYI